MIIGGFLMRIFWHKVVIMSEIGKLIAGYFFHNVSVQKLDDLYVTDFCLNTSLISTVLDKLNLLALVEWDIRKLCNTCAVINIQEQLAKLKHSLVSCN